MADLYTARELSQELQSTAEQQKEEERTIVLTMTTGSKPNVSFTGFWNGHLIKAAMNSISKSYRLRRHKNIRPHAGVKKEEGDA